MMQDRNKGETRAKRYLCVGSSRRFFVAHRESASSSTGLELEEHETALRRAPSARRFTSPCEADVSESATTLLPENDVRLAPSQSSPP